MSETKKTSDNVSPDEVRTELERVLAGEDFFRSPRLSRFLRLIAEESLAGRGKRINGTQVAIEVFDRDESFDPRIDPVVRAEAGRLRRAMTSRSKNWWRACARQDSDALRNGFPPRRGLARR